jgi:hypothetical protein
MSNNSGRTTNYGSKLPVKSNNSSVNKSERSDAVNRYFKEGDALKLSDTPILDFSADLQSAINSGTPMFLWSKTRLNNKIRLDNEKQILILEKIRNLRAINTELYLLKADEIFSEEYILNLVAEKRMQAEHIFEAAVATHRLRLTKIKSEIDLTVSLTEHDQIEKDRKRAENEKLIAEAESIRAGNLLKYAQADKIKAEAESLRSKNDLYALVVSKIDFNNFPPVHLTYLLSVLSGFDTNSFSDLDIKEKLKDVMVNMEETKFKKAEAEVNDFINSADFRKWKNDQARRDAGGL